ncbi:hypothetical protein DASC09_055460 [Saccharomycopsis crataegensis]|uniref:Zn(2)-C6 fungal-type domain-containing protein n=1 Tax=Saccharomycopsis crataegensis TaxID=43959 RepID=A0AAV5QUH1_9ASCO|nr:hypothetical protein DASC09_055460 [Saccharomycopsis crataegensis]
MSEFSEDDIQSYLNIIVDNNIPIESDSDGVPTMQSAEVDHSKGLDNSGFATNGSFNSSIHNGSEQTINPAHMHHDTSILTALTTSSTFGENIIGLTFDNDYIATGEETSYPGYEIAHNDVFDNFLGNIDDKFPIDEYSENEKAMFHAPIKNTTPVVDDCDKRKINNKPIDKIVIGSNSGSKSNSIAKSKISGRITKAATKKYRSRNPLSSFDSNKLNIMKKKKNKADDSKRASIVKENFSSEVSSDKMLKIKMEEEVPQIDADEKRLMNPPLNNPSDKIIQKNASNINEYHSFSVIDYRTSKTEPAFKSFDRSCHRRYSGRVRKPVVFFDPSEEQSRAFRSSSIRSLSNNTIKKFSENSNTDLTTSRSESQSRIRQKAERSKNGCWTCRVRRKKCPEGKPACNQCLRLGSLCDGYSEERPRFMFDKIAQAKKLKEIRQQTDKFRMARIKRLHESVRKKSRNITEV